MNEPINPPCYGGAKLKTLIDRIESQRAELLSYLNGFTDKQLNFHPSEDAWSMLQVLNHLVIADEGFLRSATRKKKSELQKVLLRSTLEIQAIRLLYKTPMRFKVPIKELHPPDGIPLETLRERWNAARENLKMYLDSLETSDLELGIFRHPYAGRITPAQTLDFILIHVYHHFKQMERIRKSAAFPSV